MKGLIAVRTINKIDEVQELPKLIWSKKLSIDVTQISLFSQAPIMDIQWGSEVRTSLFHVMYRNSKCQPVLSISTGLKEVGFQMVQILNGI